MAFRAIPTTWCAAHQTCAHETECGGIGLAFHFFLAVRWRNGTVTERGASIRNVQSGFVPLQLPAQRVKTHPRAGLAVNLTRRPNAKPPEQREPQLIPEGELTIAPCPTR